jgi:hypothetical protein
VEIRKSYLAMIKAFPGGWDAITGALGMSRDALENRIYERKGQGVQVELALQLQKFAGTTHFAEAVAVQSGGSFVKLPDDLDQCNELISKKFREVNIRLGEFSAEFDEAIKDDEIDAGERRKLEAIAAGMQRAVAELLALSFRVYCRPDVERAE